MKKRLTQRYQNKSVILALIFKSDSFESEAHC